MKDFKIKKAILGAVITVIVLGLSAASYGSSVGDSPKAGTVKTIVKKIPQREFKEAEQDIVFVLDNSGSMKNNDPNFITKEVVTNFVNDLEEKSHLGMVIFDEAAKLIEPLTSLDNPEVRARFLNGLEAINFSGKFTNSPAGIERAIYELKINGRHDSKRIIILLTDGIVDTGNKNQDLEQEKWLKEDLTRESKKAGIRIFGIAFTEDADFHLIQTLAMRTDGEYFRVLEVADLERVFGEINRIITKTPVQKIPVAAVEENLMAPAEQKAASEQQLRDASGMDAEENKSFVLILTGIIIVLALAFALSLVKKRTTHATKPGGDEETPARILPSAPPVPQAVLIDVGKAISKESLTLSLNKKHLKIGRDSGNDIVIPKKTISSFHATISYNDGYFYLEDLRSTNGTRLNNNELKHNEPNRLKSGDKIDFSIHEFRFLLPDQTPLGETVADLRHIAQKRGPREASIS